jgi:hypothetical protein
MHLDVQIFTFPFQLTGFVIFSLGANDLNGDVGVIGPGLDALQVLPEKPEVVHLSGDDSGIQKDALVESMYFHVMRIKDSAYDPKRQSFFIFGSRRQDRAINKGAGHNGEILESFASYRLAELFVQVSLQRENGNGEQVVYGYGRRSEMNCSIQFVEDVFLPVKIESIFQLIFKSRRIVFPVEVVIGVRQKEKERCSLSGFRAQVETL